MSRYLWPISAVILLAILGWICPNLVLENDGLKQVIAENQRSTRALLNYIAVATRCEVTPQEVAEAVSGTIYRDQRGAVTDVSHLSFKAEFKNDRVQSVQIVGAGKSLVCKAK